MFVRLEALPTELVAAAGARHMIAAHVFFNLTEILARQFTTGVRSLSKRLLHLNFCSSINLTIHLTCVQYTSIAYAAINLLYHAYD